MLYARASSRGCRILITRIAIPEPDVRPLPEIFDGLAEYSFEFDRQDCTIGRPEREGRSYHVGPPCPRHSHTTDTNQFLQRWQDPDQPKGLFKETGREFHHCT